MKKVKTIKKLINKQKEEYGKPIALYNQNEKFKTIVNYTEYYIKEKLQKNDVLIIGSKSVSKSMYELIRMIREKFPKKRIILALDSEINTFNENVTIIPKKSDDFIMHLAKSQVIINNVILPSYFIKREDQVVIQLTDLFSGIFSSEDQYKIYKTSIQRTLFQCSHILFKNSEESTFYIDLFNLRGIYNGRVYESANLYFSSNRLGMTTNNELLILTKKYSIEEVTILLEKARNKFENFYVYVHPSLYNFYENIQELQYILIASTITKEDLNLQSSRIISDNLSDLIGDDNFYFEIQKNEIKISSYDKQHYATNFDIIERILKNKEKDYIKVNNDKKNILMYCGGFLNNGITSSAINLSHAIDYNDYNLIIIEKGNLGKIEKDNMRRIHPNANLLYRGGQSNTTLKEYRKNMFVTQRRGYRKYLGKKDLQRFYNRELRRLVGNIDIDIAVDFSGYVPFWTAMFAFSKAKKKVIYQHNDLKSETEKQIQGQFKHKYILPRVFSLYNFFDKVISVSLQTKDLNAINLKKYSPEYKFDYVNNLINFEDILRKINCDKPVSKKTYNDEEFLILEKFNDVSIVKPIIPKNKEIELVTIGRLSPEKDHHKLFLALKKLIDEYPNIDIKLKVIGSGVMEDELKKLINQLELDNYIEMIGQVPNPYKYLNNADCFILSSNHEGQPMVLLEALALHKPIIATDITGNRSVLKDTNGLLVNNSIEGLKYGLEQLVMGNIKSNSQFNINNYNKSAISMFYDKVCTH